MKAARIHRFGPPHVVVVEDVPMPSPGLGEVLVRQAQGMLAGAPHKSGKIVLQIGHPR